MLGPDADESSASTQLPGVCAISEGAGNVGPHATLTTRMLEPRATLIT